jgi:hypothetical protein
MLTGLYTMQDTVDDSEGMASSSESEDDEENDSLVCIMADSNLWCTQVSFFFRDLTNFLVLSLWHGEIATTSNSLHMN